MAFTLLFSLLLVHHIQKDPSSTGICTKTVFQDVMGEKARQPALEFIIQSGIPFRVTQFPPEKKWGVLFREAWKKGDSVIFLVTKPQSLGDSSIKYFYVRINGRGEVALWVFLYLILKYLSGII